MNNNRLIKNEKKHWPLVLIFLLLALSPIVIYLYKFHYGLSNDFNRWSAFGSYFGGIYGPLLSFLSLLILIRTLFQMKNSQEQDRIQFNLQLNEQIRQRNIDDIIMLTKMIRDAFDNNPLVLDIKTYPDDFHKKISLICFNRHYNNPISSIDDVWSIAFELMRKDKYFDSEIHILGEVLQRMHSLSNKTDQKTAKSIIKGLIPQSQRFLLKCYAHINHPQARKHIERWPDFCHTPSKFNQYLDNWGKVSQ